MRFSFIYSPFSKFICSTSLDNVTEQSEDCGDKFQNDRIQSLKQYGAKHRFTTGYAYCNAIVYMTALEQVYHIYRRSAEGFLLTKSAIIRRFFKYFRIYININRRFVVTSFSLIKSNVTVFFKQFQCLIEIIRFCKNFISALLQQC